MNSVMGCRIHSCKTSSLYATQVSPSSLSRMKSYSLMTRPHVEHRVHHVNLDTDAKDVVHSLEAVKSYNQHRPPSNIWDAHEREAHENNEVHHGFLRKRLLVDALPPVEGDVLGGVCGEQVVVEGQLPGLVEVRPQATLPRIGEAPDKLSFVSKNLSSAISTFRRLRSGGTG